MTSTRDSRAEARKAWRQIRSSAIRYDFTGSDLNLLRSFLMHHLESLARREYEAGVRAGMAQKLRAVVQAKLKQKYGCCYAGSVQACPHHEQARRSG